MMMIYKASILAGLAAGFRTSMNTSFVQGDDLHNTLTEEQLKAELEHLVMLKEEQLKAEIDLKQEKLRAEIEHDNMLKQEKLRAEIRYVKSQIEPLQQQSEQLQKQMEELQKQLEAEMDVARLYAYLDDTPTEAVTDQTLGEFLDSCVTDEQRRERYVAKIKIELSHVCILN